MSGFSLGRTPRYLAVTGSCFLFNNALLITLAWQNLHYIGCVLAAATVMIPLSYVLHARLTFEQAGKAVTFLRFAAIQAVNIPAAALLFYIFSSILGLSVVVASPLVTTTMFVWNFAGSWWAMRAFS